MSARENNEDEPMPWLVRLRLECLKVSREESRFRGMRDLEVLAEQYVVWTLGTELYQRLVGPLPAQTTASRPDVRQVAQN